jgi:hypothetical protein
MTPLYQLSSPRRRLHAEALGHHYYLTEMEMVVPER